MSRPNTGTMPIDKKNHANFGSATKKIISINNIMILRINNIKPFILSDTIMFVKYINFIVNSNDRLRWR